jgi:hypothetical protein
MGKNRSAVSGLSRFLQALKEAEPSSSNAITYTTEEPSTTETQDHDDSARPAKKRKIGLLEPGYERYDATSLVQFYTHPSEVPDHLKKCKQHTTHITFMMSLSRREHIKIFFREQDFFRCTILVVCLTRKGGTASLRNE